jgi:hypothetical protein
MAGSKVLRVIVALDSLLMAYGHAPLALFLASLFRMGGPPGRPLAVPPGAFTFFLALGGYFLFATIIYVLGAIFVASGKLFKLANFGLIVMALVDDVLLVYTRTVPGNIFFNRIVPWSWEWFPRLGTVQVLVGQTILIVLCAVLYRSK